MSKYKYRVSMSYLDVASSTETSIRVECIRTIIIDRDYDNTNMPILMMTLKLDKNLVDDIILNAKNNVFNIFMYKFSETGDKYAEKVFQGQFVYFLNEDLNYNKDLDYNNEEAAANQGMIRKDKYRDITVGLMMKKNLDDNKKVVNDIYKNTSMINIVSAVTSELNILIEPFTYDNIISELVVPPLDTISQALKKLNEISVFYDTKYRYFLDFDTAYLLSSAGNPIPKRGEQYNSIYIDIRNITTNNAFEEGMCVEDGHYLIPISTLDSKYTANNVTDKEFNNLKAILDASKDQVEKHKNSLMGTVNSLKNAAKKINNAVNGLQSKLSNIGNDLNTMKSEIIEDAESALETSISIYDVTVKIDKIFSDPGISVDVKNETLKDMYEAYSRIEQTIESIQHIPSEYDSIRDKVFNNFVNASDFGNYINGVEPINMTDNTTALKKLYTSVKDESNKNISVVEEILAPAANRYTTMVDDIDTIIKCIRDLPDSIESADSGGSGGEGETTTSIDVSAAKKYIVELEALKPSVSECAERMSKNTDNIRAIPKDCAKTAENANFGIDELIATHNTLKDEFKGTSIANSSSLIVSSATKEIKKKKEENAKLVVTGFRDFGKQSIDKFTNLGKSIVTDITSVVENAKDISSILSSGIPEVDLDINVNKSDFSKEKFKFIRLPNDNANLLKQMKYDLELSAYRLVINKNDLDSLVTTPNKEYYIKNYDTHSDKDGKFLLARKKEIFIREDDTFTLNTILELKKIPENN